LFPAFIYTIKKLAKEEYERINNKDKNP